MAGLLKRNGKYYAQFYDSNRNPIRKRLSLRTRDKRKARSVLTTLESDYATGEFDPWTDDPRHYKREEFEEVSYGEARNRFLEQKRNEGCSEHTIRTYRSILRLFGKEVGYEKSLSRVSTNEVQKFVSNPSVSKATCRKRYGHIKAFMRWGERKKLLRKNPVQTVNPPEKPQKLPKAITESELNRICKAVREDYAEKRKKNKVREGQIIWRIPLFRFAFCTGMRGSELSRLRWEHIDFQKRLIYIFEQKNGKEQTIPLSGRARKILIDIKDGSESDFVFRPPGSEAQQRDARSFRERASQTFREARDRAGVDRDKSLHSLRHGFCTRLAEAGKPLHVIKEAARHADVSTSMIYVHMVNEHLKGELDDVFG